MASFSTILTSVIEFTSKSFFKTSLTSAGIGFGSYLVMRETYDQFLSYTTQNFYNLTTILYAINLTGLDVGLSIILSAIGIRVYLNSQKIFLRKL